MVTDGWKASHRIEPEHGPVLSRLSRLYFIFGIFGPPHSPGGFLPEVLTSQKKGHSAEWPFPAGDDLDRVTQALQGFGDLFAGGGGDTPW
jgi:hypothetical protein